jgi:hypothetical protein
MAQPAERRNRSGFAVSGAPADVAIKALIDELIVPHLVEEFLRLHGPAAAAKSKDKDLHVQLESELNSTP